MDVCPDDIFWIAELFTKKKLCMVMHHYGPDCVPKRLVCCPQGHCHSEGSYNQSMTFKCFMLWSRSRSQKRFRIPVTSLDNISSTAEPYVTKLGKVMHHHWPECHARKLVCCLQVQGHTEAHIIKYDCVYHIYWTTDFLATKFNWMVHYHQLECFV